MMKNNYIKQKRKDQNPVNHWKIFEGRLVFLLAMVILVVVAYTFILQQAYTKTALKTEIERDISSADAVHKLVNDRLGRKDFNEIKSKADENTELFKNMSTYMNEIRTLNSTRYIYTANRNEDGRLIYVVDGLDPSAGDVRHPGDPIEKEMVPYIEKALSGKTVYSQDIVDTTWGPIFTACYPVTADDESNEVILKMFALEHGISIVLKDSDEKVLGIYGDMEYSLAPGTDVEDILLGSGITESYSCKLTNGKTYWIQVFGNKEKVNIGLESLKRILPMLGAITFLAALAIAALYTKYITRSILKVSEVSKKMANLDFRVRYTEDRRDEIGILGENLNELSEKLESALDELKEKNTDLEKSIKLEQQLEQQQMAFFSAVSHELKTPITILKGQIQGMLLEVGGYKDRDRYLKRSFEVANSMENMVQEILYVSKIRTSGFELKLIDIPLHQLVENVIKEQEDMAIDRGLQFHIRIEESTWIRADEALFTKVISNVVGNAIKYTNEDGNIWVGVYKRGEEIIFWIENETESIDEKEIPKLCDAFYRIDKSRNKRTGGSGLGLYITKMILEQHQFPYCIENTEKGIKVEIRCYEPTRRLL